MSVYIINKAGGLIYQKDFRQSITSSLTINDHLVLASTFHGLFAMANEVSPVPDCTSGMKSFSTELITLCCLETPTGTKFLITGDKTISGKLNDALDEIYRVYSDFVLKNPFHQPDQPIKAVKFDERVKDIVTAL